MAHKIYLKIYDEERNLIVKQRVLSNQLIPLKTMDSKGFIMFEVISESR